MRDLVRSVATPFFAALFPGIWYVNRNLTTEVLPPRTEPTVEVVAAGVAGSVGGALVVALLLVPLRRRDVDDERLLPRYRRIVQLDDAALVAFLGFQSLVALWAVVVLAGFGPSVLGAALTASLVPLVLPFLALVPLAIYSHVATIAGLVLSVLWMALLATLVSDAIHRRRSTAGRRGTDRSGADPGRPD